MEPVSRVDGHTVGDAARRPVLGQLRAACWAAVETYVAGPGRHRGGRSDVAAS